MLSTIALAAGTAVATFGYGVTFGPGAGGFNDVGLHEGAQVGGSANYWRPQHASDLASVQLQNTRKEASGCHGPYSGVDCEERTCPYGLSSSASPFLKNGFTAAEHLDDDKFAPTSRMEDCVLVNGACDPSTFQGDTNSFLGQHTYTECSSQGICDRKTGICECFAGYNGLGCRYTTCPNSCSGHGMCLQNAKANTEYDTTNSFGFFGSQYWDAYKSMRCVCDRGFSGYDCTERICPHGDDVLTTCGAEVAFDVQTINLDFNGAVISTVEEKSRFFTLSYVDGFNGHYTTAPIPVMNTVEATAALTQLALEALPNDAIPSVQVSGTETLSTQSLFVTFSDASTSGIQTDLACMVRPVDEVCEAGQQPRVDSSLAAEDFTCVLEGHLSKDPADFEENAECGNRGICDKTTGKCACFLGHAGEACATLSIYV